MTILITPSDKIWFGYSKASGWVIYDRNIYTNRPATTEKNILIIKCSDWSVFKESKKTFEAKKTYTYVNNYIDGQQDSGTNSSDIEVEARKLLNEYIEIHRKNILEKYESLGVEAQRRKFFEKQNLPYIGFKKSSKTKDRRTSYDWNCKNPVDNYIDYECEECGWIICNKCGACKQGGCN